LDFDAVRRLLVLCSAIFRIVMAIVVLLAVQPRIWK
jgi:hypothetical protein